MSNDWDRNKAVENAGGQHRMVIMATLRTRQIQHGSPVRITPEEAKGHKNAVIALKEIEQGLYTYEEYVSDIRGY